MGDQWTQHLYTYTANNPVMMVDPTGHWGISITGSAGEDQQIIAQRKKKGLSVPVVGDEHRAQMAGSSSVGSGGGTGSGGGGGGSRGWIQEEDGNIIVISGWKDIYRKGYDIRYEGPKKYYKDSKGHWHVRGPNGEEWVITEDGEWSHKGKSERSGKMPKGLEEEFEEKTGVKVPPYPGSRTSSSEISQYYDHIYGYGYHSGPIESPHYYGEGPTREERTMILAVGGTAMVAIVFGPAVLPFIYIFKEVISGA